jgi:hypothetical protein
VFAFKLEPQDHDRLADVLRRSTLLEGDVFDLERDRQGRHGRIMKYNLNEGKA